MWLNKSSLSFRKNKALRKDEFNWPSKFRAAHAKKKVWKKLNTLGVSSGYLGWIHSLADYKILANLINSRKVSKKSGINFGAGVTAEKKDSNLDRYLSAMSDSRLINLPVLETHWWVCNHCNKTNYTDLRVTECSKCRRMYRRNENSISQSRHLNDADIPF